MSKKILAVDDENDVLLIIKTALVSEGYTVFTAANGADALVLVEEKKPDLLILDLMMPEMDGFTVVDKMKEKTSSSNIPVIILTGLSERKKIKELLDKGIKYYIIKPFEYQDLISKVKLAIEETSGDLFSL